MKLLCQCLVGGMAMLISTTSHAETKVDASVEHELNRDSTARVIIITRADPEVAGGGAPLTAPQSYVADMLDMDPAMVRPLGSVPAVSTTVTMQQLEQLRDNPNIEAVVADIPVPPTTDVSIPLIGASKVHEKGYIGTNRSVAILDTGLDATHKAFVGAVAAEACFSTTAGGTHPSTSLCPQGLDMSLLAGAAALCPQAIRGCDHGTHVAGIVAGRKVSAAGKTFIGAAPGAKIIPVQVFSVFTNPRDCRGGAPCVLSYPSDQFRALDWIMKRHGDLRIASVNMSLGGGSFDRPCDGQSALTQLIERLRAKGVLTVIAAGNNAFYDAVSMPGCISSAITVAATTKAGAMDTSYSNVSPQVDLAAPGTAITSTVYGSAYGLKSGTSMAAPHVAGAIALLRDEYPGASANELEARLKIGAPVIADPRTGLSFASLEVARTLPGAIVGGAGLPAPPAATVGGASDTVAAAGSSFIIQSSSRPEDVESSVAAACEGNRCALKQIGENAWKLDIGASSKLARENPRLQPLAVEKALKALATGTKVFANTPQAALGE